MLETLGDTWKAIKFIASLRSLAPKKILTYGRPWFLFLLGVATKTSCWSGLSLDEMGFDGYFWISVVLRHSLELRSLDHWGAYKRLADVKMLRFHADDNLRLSHG